MYAGRAHNKAQNQTLRRATRIRPGEAIRYG
jgi:hypothetical protein